MKKKSENSDEFTFEKELLDLMDAVPFGNSRFQIEKFVIPQEGSPHRSARQVLLDLYGKYTALKESMYKKRKHDITMRKKKKQMQETKDEFEKEMLQVEIDEAEFGVFTQEKLIKDALIEIKIFMDALKELLTIIGENFNRDVYDKADPYYWLARAIKQAERSFIATGSIGEGNVGMLEQLGVQPRSVIEALSKGHTGDVIAIETAKQLKLSSPEDVKKLDEKNHE